MKFYITEETRQELEAKIVEIEESYFKVKGNDDPDEHYLDGARTYLKEILSSATILPVEESWDHVDENTHTIPKVYPNGVIIQPK